MVIDATPMTPLIRTATAILFAVSVATSHALDFQGVSDKVIEITPEASSGLKSVYVLRDAAGATVSYPSPAARWSTFGAAGGAYAEPMES